MSGASYPGYLPPPEGWQLNMDNPYQYGHIQGYWTGGFGLGLATILLGIRIYTKTMITRNFGLEDVFLLLSYLFGIGVQAIMLHTWIDKSSGVHGWEVPVERFNHFVFVTAIVSIIYVPCLGFAKISILCLYKGLSPLRWFKISVYTVMGIVGAYSIGLAFAFIFPCDPIAKNWDATITEGKCVDKAAIYLGNAAINAITDIMILLLPIPMVLKLQMPRVQKIGLIGMFAFGSATCITSLVRLYYMVPMLKNVDLTYAISIPFVWVNVEANLVTICICLPILRPFLRKVAPSLIGEYRMGSYGSSSGQQRSLPFSSKPANSGIPGHRGQRTEYGMMNDSDRDIELSGMRAEVYASHDKGFRQGDDGPRRDSTDNDHDGSSEKAIWQTRTVTISRE